MERRQALQALLVLVGNGLKRPDYNILIDLSVLKGWEVRLGEESIFISGPELFKALKGK